MSLTRSSFISSGFGPESETESGKPPPKGGGKCPRIHAGDGLRCQLRSPFRRPQRNVAGTISLRLAGVGLVLNLAGPAPLGRRAFLVSRGLGLLPSRALPGAVVEYDFPDSPNATLSNFRSRFEAGLRCT